MNKIQFVYSEYWSTWSRLLSPSCTEYHGMVVELNLTPIMSHGQRGWEKQVKPAIIRAHFTPKCSPREYPVDQLPGNIKALMLTELGENFMNYLLNENFLDQIDWELYDKYNNGGASFELIKKS